MKTKSVVQLLIPAASTVLLFIVFWLLSFIVYVLAYLIIEGTEIDHRFIDNFLGSIAKFLQVNIFEYRNIYNGEVNINTVVFWIINVLLIIVGELWATDDDNF